MIRGARPGDVDGIAQLYERSYGTLRFLPTLHTPEETRTWFAGVVAEREVWIWEEEGAALGFILLGEGLQNLLKVERST